ncbi:hypothetical protein A2160_03815 [Candidatus Beckwithbacteria bacterium RBG_13_42_9]|uniref:DUF1648 domain-containing protein n=1 Tax=Candidatus Beckwithbacteria bacterium RBG_13_42_9 TaxID=1797457 RepID=A0A1F5E4L3_9BACT|nr:MAG: hypothetical protein A2160_03815 [Candidatus Beckwithbacteria bacterium RBG_13_42_9]
MAQLTFNQQRLTFSQAKEEFDSLLKHRSSSLSIKFTLIFLGLSWLILVLFWHKLPPQVPLLYSRPWGEDQLLAKPFILILPGLATLLTLINLRLASILFQKERFLSQSIVWLNVLVVILSITTLIRILLIIT